MIEFKTFDLKIKTKESKEIEIIGGKRIKVRQFLSSFDKRDLLLITLQQSVVDNIINPFYLDINFHVNLIKMYAEITFDEAEAKDNFDLYDKLTQTEIFDKIIEVIPSKDYIELQENLNALVEKYEKYSHSVTAVINGFINQLPENVENAESAIKKFDPDTLKQIVELAKSTGYK